MTHKQLEQEILALKAENLTQKGLLQIQQAVQKMARPQDLERVMHVCLQETNRMGLGICSMALHLMVQAEQCMVETFRFGLDGPITIGEHRKSLQLTNLWKTGERSNLADVDLGPREDALRMRKAFAGLLIRSYMDVSFSQGIISLQSLSPNSFSEADETILVQIGEIFSAGIARMRELEYVEDRLRLEQAYRDIAQMTLSSLSLDGVLDNLGVHMMHAGIFRSLSISLVDNNTHQVEIVRGFFCQDDGTIIQPEGRGVGNLYALDSEDPIAVVARKGEMLTIEGYDPTFSGMTSSESYYLERAFYFVPVNKGDETVAVLATSGHVNEKEDMLRKLEAMQPLLDQVVIAIENARLYEYAQQEISERERAEVEARENLAKYHHLFESMRQGVVYQSENGEIISANPAASQILGLNLDQLQGRESVDPRWRAIHEDGSDYAGEKHPAMMALKTGQDVIGKMMGVFNPNVETYVWILIDAIPQFRPGEDKPYCVYTTFTDITERRGAQKALLESESRFRQLAENIQEVFWMTNIKKDEMLYVSPAYEKIWGRSCERLYAEPSNWVDAIHPDDRDAILKVAETQQLQGNYDEEYRIVRPDGSVRWIRDRAFPVLDAFGKVYRIVGLAEDISVRKEIEQELIRVQRLRATNELSAGVSHNLNNILMGVLGPVQLLQLQVHDDDVRVELDEIFTAAMRARDLVHRLHLSSQGAVDTDLQPVPMNKMVLEAIQNTRPKWKDELEAKGIVIDVATTFQEVPFVKATASDVSDILVNLMLNAVDAMPQGGKVSIETQAVDGDVLLTFSDTGIGMEENVQARVFEPFFTTKADVGTGLGLSTVYRAMVQWGGNITLVSEPNLGTTFTLRFPIWTESELSSDVVLKENVNANTVRSGKILVVEDDALVSQVLVRLLSQYHGVVTVAAGQEALDALDLETYDVALIDLGLPEMPGDQVAKRIRHKDLAIALVLITGWELESTDPRLLAFDFYVQKPIDDIGKILDIVSQAVALRAERAPK